MHKLVFYPVGNGDTSQIILANGKRLLFDFRHVGESEDEVSPYIDLKKQLRDELEAVNRDSFDVVAFTHGDDDHIKNSTSFFYLQHAEKYQSDDRIKIDELWVPAAMILETAPTDAQSDEFVIWRQEARHRLKQGEGIQVFSKPDKLKTWLEGEGLPLAEREHLITDAGCLAKGLSIVNDEVEFFCHSPFIKHCDEGEDLRNSAALIFQVRFQVDNVITNFWAVGDTTYEVLEDVVDITQYHNNDDRLDWDILNIPHHCSYKVLADDKGDKETIPTEKVKDWLLHGQNDSYLVSSSQPINNDQDAYEQVQPPHIQAKNCYQSYLDQVGGRTLLVTMEEPNETKPEPLVFEIGGDGHRLKAKLITGAASIVSAAAPRAGRGGQ